MKVLRSIQKYMTYFAKTIDSDQSYDQANEVMRKLHLRYIPVMKAGTVVGVLTDHDLNLILSLKGIDTSHLKIEDVYSPQLYVTGPKAELKSVVLEMAARRLSSCLVVDAGKPIGIFTLIDAMNALLDLTSEK